MFLIFFSAAYFQRRIHQGDVERLAQLSFLLLEMRRESSRAAVRAERRESLLHQVLRGQFLQPLRRVQEEHRYRFEEVRGRGEGTHPGR